MRVDNTSFSSSSSRGGRGGSSSSARDRSNPLAQSGRSRRGGSNASRSGADSGIRGAADRRGRVPGGGELIGSSSASVIAAAQNGNSNASGSGSSSNQAGGKLIEGLKSFLASRWNEAAQFLNLEVSIEVEEGGLEKERRLFSFPSFPEARNWFLYSFPFPSLRTCHKIQFF